MKSVSFTIMSVMEKQTAEMAQMRTNAYQYVKQVIQWLVCGFDLLDMGLLSCSG